MDMQKMSIFHELFLCLIDKIIKELFNRNVPNILWPMFYLQNNISDVLSVDI